MVIRSAVKELRCNTQTHTNFCNCNISGIFSFVVEKSFTQFKPVKFIVILIYRMCTLQLITYIRYKLYL